MDNNAVITLDPTTLQSDQTTFNGNAPDLKGSGPLQPGQQYAPGYDSAGLPLMQAFQNMNTNQLSNLFSQVQAWIEANPTIAVLGGLGILIMAANKKGK